MYIIRALASYGTPKYLNHLLPPWADEACAKEPTLLGIELRSSAWEATKITSTPWQGPPNDHYGPAVTNMGPVGTDMGPFGTSMGKGLLWA